MKVRKAAAALALLLIVVGGVELHYLTIWRVDRATARRHLTELPYRKLPGLRSFLLEVRSATPSGATIALAMPAARWEGGYEYAYYRSAYLLAGRQPLPMIDTQNRASPEVLRSADFLACFQCMPHAELGSVVLKTSGGTLVRLR